MPFQYKKVEDIVKDKKKKENDMNKEEQEEILEFLEEKEEEDEFDAQETLSGLITKVELNEKVNFKGEYKEEEIVDEYESYDESD